MLQLMMTIKTIKIIMYGLTPIKKEKPALNKTLRIQTTQRMDFELSWLVLFNLDNFLRCNVIYKFWKPT